MPTADPDPGDRSRSNVEPAARAGDVPIVESRPARRWAWTLSAGVVAGLIAWLGGELCLDLFKAPRHPAESRGHTLMVVLPREQELADVRNAGLAFAWLGAALGASLGAAGGIIGRSGRAAATAAGIGLAAGAIACAGLSATILPRYDAYKHRDPDAASRDLMAPIVVLGGIWSAAGAAGGLAYGLGLGARRGISSLVLAGLGGALLGAAIYLLIGAFVLPMDETTRFVAARWPSRLLARLVVTILAATAVAWAADPRPEAR